MVEKKYKIVVLLMDDRGIPKTLEERLDIADRLYRRLTEAGLPSNYIYFGILVLSVAVEPDSGPLTLKMIKTMRSHFLKSHLICGINNISMALPGRRLINRTFLTMAIYAGLDTLLIDTKNKTLMSSTYATKILLNQDTYCLEYQKAYREKKILI